MIEIKEFHLFRLFENKSRSTAVYEKLKCLLHYFDRVITEGKRL